ncbi:DUF5518 domain-containing protein [Halarchaeum sp. P4]|uniref:DUF5518 domain-containing protein n=1 Tax=Halarchaeum sp. P4 TaxID=3421639 RepID=UPI003EBFF5E4
MADRSPLLNALLGAVASVVLAFLPFSPVLGGALAGYLQGPDERDGLRVGALSGLIASVPILFVVLLAAVFLPFVPLEVAAVGIVLVVLVVFFVVAYTVLLSAVGGWLGAYAYREL